MWNLTFWKDCFERAVSTAAQTALALLGADGFDLLNVDIADVFGVSLGGAVLSILKSIVASRFNDPDSASFLDLPGKHAAQEPAPNGDK